MSNFGQYLGKNDAHRDLSCASLQQEETGERKSGGLFSCPRENSWISSSSFGFLVLILSWSLAMAFELPSFIKRFPRSAHRSSNFYGSSNRLKLREARLRVLNIMSSVRAAWLSQSRLRSQDSLYSQGNFFCHFRSFSRASEIISNSLAFFYDFLGCIKHGSRSTALSYVIEHPSP